MRLVNRCKAALKKFKFEELTKEQFDALILLSALKSPADEPLRARILQKLDQDGYQVRFDDIITDCVDFLATKADCRVFANENLHLNAVQKPLQERRQRRKHPPSQKRQPSKPTAQNDPSSPSFLCGDLHWCKGCTHLKHQCSKCKRTGHLARQCDHIHNHHSNPKHSKVGLTLMGTVRQSPKSSGLMKMEIDVDGVQVQFYLGTGTEVNIISKETFDYIGALSLQKCDEVARMYNGQAATFLGKGRAVFKRRNHAAEDVFYVAPRVSLNLHSYPTIQRLGLYIANAEAVNAFSTEHPSTSNIKTDTVASLKKTPSLTASRTGCTVHRDKGDAHPQTKRDPSLPSRQASALRLSTDCGARA
jgi:hypothetical protein